MQENKVKKYKILGDSFKQYIAVSKNTFSETKTNKITEKNVEEIISSFEKSNVEIFVYMGHKEEEERVAIGKVLKLEKDNEAIGIYATIEWFDESITEKKSFYPSIEMVGKKIKEDDEFIYWENCEIKAIAAVEYPASKSVDLLCASGVIEVNEDYINNIKNILNKLNDETTKEKAKEEFLNIFRNDEEFQNMIIDLLLEKFKITEKSLSKSNLSAITYGDWCNEYAESQNAVRCSSKSESDTYVKAKKLFKAGLSKEEIMSIVRDDLVPIGVGGYERVSLSAMGKNKYEEISRMFK
ncbi:phage capsid protein [Brachyspira pilosicoli]|uniref:phage capsid protein n=1 Tax=Brachyspira pilosicoli TaxID=52584 RepID=UPI001CA521A1|nr:phage capsid protein [Brachyspira pilosicoli]MBW5399037.1 phage capsid protein [Brachyspira pilosicoli]